MSSWNGVVLTAAARWWLDFCADPDIAGGNCLNICESSRGSFGNTRMTSCNGQKDSERWCCGDTDDCCTTGIDVIKLAQVFKASPRPSSSTSTTSTTSSTGASTASTSAARLSASGLVNASPSGKPGISGGAI